MTDQAAASALLETCPPSLRLALMDAAERAVSTLNAGLGHSLQQPAQAPADAAAWRDALAHEVGWRVVRFWLSLSEADLRVAGIYLALAILHQVIAQGHTGLDVLRQFSAQPPLPPGAAPIASPAPGSSA